MEKPEGEIFIIPARLEECNTLENLRRWHWVDIFDDDGYKMLIRALQNRSDNIGVTLLSNGSWSQNVITPNVGDGRSTVEKRDILSKTKSVRKLNTGIIVALIGFVGTIIAILSSSPVVEK